MKRFAIPFAAFSLLAAACTGVGTDEADATSIPYAEGSPEAVAITAVANDRNLGVAEFDSSDGVGLDKRAAENLVAHRDGADAGSTADDNPFDSLAEVWSVSHCKRSCVDAILEYAIDTGVYNPGGGNNGSGDGYVIMSPQEMDVSHLAEAAAKIDTAMHSIDIAMYSYSHQDPVKGALERALDRGVKIRVVADTDLANSASKGGGLEKTGIDVRRVTKIMHHKFAIIDGPRDNASLGNADTARIVTGSGNWSSSAATRYDENTLFLEGYPELALRLQRDFDTIWAGSKDVVHEEFEFDGTRADITDELIAANDSPDVDVHLTSFNFKSTSSKGWSYLGTTVVTDALTDAIRNADDSLEIASGHFVSEPIAQAVVDAMAANPDLSVKIVVDCQETSKGGTIGSLKDQIENAGGSFFYKCTTYRWHYTMAAQMHHKYMIVDGEELWTGSLNFSDNAETNTMENMIHLKGARHADLVAAYRANFEMVRGYGHEDNMAALTDLQDDIVNGSSVPLTWSNPISMDLATFQDLKDLIREECPATKSWENTGPAKTYNALFTNHASWFKYCSKSGYPWPQVPEDMRL